MNELHRSLAEKIVRHIRTSDMSQGDHLTEKSLQDVFGISRQPIRSALAYLASVGVVEKVPNKGFFLRDPSAVAPSLFQTGDSTSDEGIYLRIADDKLAQAIPDRISENDLMRRYGISRLQLRRVLTRIAGEGWIERNEGRGWTFIALIDSLGAYRESYDLRRILEPEGLRGEGFTLDVDIMAALRRQQEMLRDGGWKTLSHMELFETNSAFHEGLAQMSGNRFLAATIARMNQLRRLVEYRQTLNRDRVRGQNAEHLAILDALDAGQTARAADLLAVHIGGARTLKATADIF
ncbi:MAG: GntR family transcriptional regulator [Paracoccus sp. (in: a-proteobacteria)]|uniref:GntR family transcriptional regulator n=1 Tax=Paracoccus sp. TaxID=267 RepID=UPI0026E10FBD|nr:GntR family transcriptional regulator [Paracoccus sp. (in: a-proteobacteria)]MDO5633056.1 GntR family transcriptional regulator [Paracoccus sp. (in: a-proteobacteria)]